MIANDELMDMDMGGMAEMDNMNSMAEMNVTQEINTSDEVVSAMVHGTVNSVMIAHRMVNIARDAIEKWNRPADDVDFIIAENVDISLFIKGAYLMFTFEIHGGDFIIVNAMTMSEPMEMPMPLPMPLAMKANEHQGEY